MKGLPTILIATLLATCALQAVELRDSFPRYLTAADNTTLADFLGHKPGRTTRATLYSDPHSRNGLFFVVELDQALKDLPEAKSVQLQVIFEGDKTPTTLQFDLGPVKDSSARALYLGLTSPEFADKKNIPHLLAWKITLQGTDELNLGQTSSPVWEY